MASIHMKDEGYRLGLGSFKALGGSYAVTRLVLEKAASILQRSMDIEDLQKPEVRGVAEDMTFACATDGNHGRSVAQGAQLTGAAAVIFLHGGVSEGRAAEIARYGARIIRVEGTYDDSVAEAARIADREGWTVVSDTSWPGYERIPGLVMQGYTAMAREILGQIPQPPTHVFLQAGVGGFAAALAGYLGIALGERRPRVIVVEPARAACLYETAKAGKPVKIPHGEPTVMAMLECYEPSLIAWRILRRLADGFMTVEESDAIGVMNRLARPESGDPAIISGESGGAGLAGLLSISGEASAMKSLGLGATSRILVINTEGATDPEKYRDLVGMTPEDVELSNTTR